MFYEYWPAGCIRAVSWLHWRIGLCAIHCNKLWLARCQWRHSTLPTAVIGRAAYHCCELMTYHWVLVASSSLSDVLIVLIDVVVWYRSAHWYSTSELYKVFIRYHVLLFQWVVVHSVVANLLILKGLLSSNYNNYDIFTKGHLVNIYLLSNQQYHCILTESILNTQTSSATVVSLAVVIQHSELYNEE